MYKVKPRNSKIKFKLKKLLKITEYLFCDSMITPQKLCFNLSLPLLLKRRVKKCRVKKMSFCVENSPLNFVQYENRRKNFQTLFSETPVIKIIRPSVPKIDVDGLKVQGFSVPKVSSRPKPLFQRKLSDDTMKALPRSKSDLCSSSSSERSPISNKSLQVEQIGVNLRTKTESPTRRPFRKRSSARSLGKI